jgi:hypothetical protein
MLRPILATFPTEEIKKSSNHKNKNTSKNQENEKKIKSKLMDVLKQIKSLQVVETTQKSSHSLEDWRDLSLSLLSSLTP